MIQNVCITPLRIMCKYSREIFGRYIIVVTHHHHILLCYLQVRWVSSESGRNSDGHCSFQRISGNDSFHLDLIYAAAFPLPSSALNIFCCGGLRSYKAPFAQILEVLCLPETEPNLQSHWERTGCARSCACGTQQILIPVSASINQPS